MPVSIALPYTNLAPPPPTSLTALVGDKSVTLNWIAAAAGDIDSYEVWRSMDGVTFTKRGDVAVPGTSYSETGLVNGTTYYYKVRVVNAAGLASVFTAALPVVPAVPADKVPPSVPTPLTAQADAAQPSVHLSWPVSVDGGTPTTGLAGYDIERSPDGTTWTVLQSLYQANTYDDTTAGFSTSWRYRVRAVDKAGNASAYASAGPLTTVTPTLRSIKVTNNSSTQVYVWVQNAVTLMWYTSSGTASLSRPVSGQWVKKNNNSVTWNSLPTGVYNVYFLTTSSWSPTKIVKTLAVDVNAGNGFATYP